MNQSIAGLSFIQVSAAAKSKSLRRSFNTLMSVDHEPTEDPFRDPNHPKVIEDEDDEGGAGIDYRRMFKGYPHTEFHG